MESGGVAMLMNVTAPKTLANEITKAPNKNTPSANKNVPLPPPTSPTTSNDRTDNRDTSILSDASLCYYTERLKTFEKWPLKFLRPEKLASNGFYYLGRGDEVRCAFCKVEIMRWEEGDDPALDHQRWAPQCSFVRKQNNSRNGSPDPTPSSGRDECGVSQVNASYRMAPPVHPEYTSVISRINSYKDWPRIMKQKPEELADAGFFYTGQGDKTKCFYCDGGLKDWESDDVPWEQHARWFDRCAYVQLNKGRDYVQKVLSDACLISQPPTKENAKASSSNGIPNTEDKTEEESNIEDSKLCKICFAEERNVVFVPCGHVVACAKCALATNKCPMCRTVLRDAVRIYYS